MSLTIVLKGLLMGVADVIPGISGGTLALILKIYERLIEAVNGLKPKVIRDFALSFCRRDWGSFKQGAKDLDLIFLMTLGVGILLGVGVASSFIPHLIANHTEPTFAVFLGLILPSLAIPVSLCKRRGLAQWLMAIVGFVIIVALSNFFKSQGGLFTQFDSFGSSAVILIISASIAISAMILPGISGSFILLLLGPYLFVTALVSRLLGDIFGKELKASVSLLNGHFSTGECFALLACFGLGCAIGLPIMSRVIAWVLARWHDLVMFFLTGMIASSIYVLWPFKNLANRDLADKNWLVKINNIWPEQVGLLTILCFSLALTLSASLVIWDLRKKDS